MGWESQVVHCPTCIKASAALYSGTFEQCRTLAKHPLRSNHQLTDCMKKKFAIVLAGAAGRMGAEVLNAISAQEDIHLAQALVSRQSNRAGDQLNHPRFADLRFSPSLDPSLGSRVMIVFALPEASMDYLEQARATALPVLMCSTGFTPEQSSVFTQAAQDIPLMLAPNTSLGIVWLARLAGELARGLPQADVEIIESHHRDKLDSPSGTALRLGRAVAQARKVELEQVAESNRTGHNRKRKPGGIGFASLRLGGVVGEHSVHFGLGGETLELTHRAISRQTFALGALSLARWLADQPAGLYRVEDALEQ